MISKTSPNGDKWSYEYDDIARRISGTYPNGQKVSYI
jgi:YD repeat-containing protein